MGGGRRGRPQQGRLRRHGGGGTGQPHRGVPVPGLTFGPVAWHTLHGLPGGGFGSSVAAGDFNGDGTGDMAVGAYFESGQVGNVYVYFGIAAWALAPAAYVTLTLPAGSQRGWSMASGDFNGDGYVDLVVGAPAGGAGRAYLYPGAAGGFLSPQELVPGVPGTSGFGQSISMGDVNLDGFADVLVGAMGNLSGSQGRVFLFLGNALGTPGAPVVLPGTPALDQMGYTVAVSGVMTPGNVGSFVAAGAGNYSTIPPSMLACDVTGAGSMTCGSVEVSPPVVAPLYLQSIQ